MSLYKCLKQFGFKSRISLIFLSKTPYFFLLHPEVKKCFSEEKIQTHHGLLPDRFIEDGESQTHRSIKKINARHF